MTPAPESPEGARILAGGFEYQNFGPAWKLTDWSNRKQKNLVESRFLGPTPGTHNAGINSWADTFLTIYPRPFRERPGHGKLLFFSPIGETVEYAY
jgi:hypothetical protein